MKAAGTCWPIYWAAGGAQTAIAVAPGAPWWEALRSSYNAPLPAGGGDPLRWREWAAAFTSELRLPDGVALNQRRYYPLRNRVKYDLFETVEDHNLGRVLGSDFVMRLGEDRFTPDIIYVHLERLGRLREYYLDGPADIVVEVPAPGHLSSLRGS